MRSFYYQLTAACLISLRASVGQPLVHSAPLSPAEELKSFHLEAGLRAELVAAEPLTIAPVAIAFDERGQMFVAENRGYPNTSHPHQGRIAVLRDTDRDGYYETRVEFAEGLTFPNGVFPWDGGVIVACAPDILFLKDSDGDGRADERKVLLTGFETNGSTQLRVSHPTLGIDNWIYLSGGLTGGKIISPQFPNKPPIDIGRSEIRFRPGTWDFEAVDGKGQFGLTFDNFNRRFTCMNRIHVQHVVVPSRYLSRNPRLAFSETMENVPASLEPEPLQGHRPAARIFPLSRNITTADSHAGTFTAACGVTIYNGDALPAEMVGNVFSCDPAANLVHRDLLESRGATFRARRATATNEFLASTDDWFRPVNLTVGPDGALYVVDMYRKIVEHPDYLPTEIRKRTDFTSGTTCGRIWRVVSDDWKRPFSIGLRRTNTAALCESLSDSNSWTRQTAQRLLLHQKDKASHLRGLLNTNGPAFGRAHALFLLADQNALSTDDLLSALKDPEPGIREIALQLLEPRLKDSPAITPAIAALARDPHPRVRFQCALTLGETKMVSKPLAQIILQDSSDRWTQAAVLSSAHEEAETLLWEVLHRADKTSPALIPFIRQLSSMIPVPKGIDSPRLETIQLPCLLAFLNGANLHPPKEKAYFERALSLAVNSDEPFPVREAAIEFVARVNPAPLLDLIGNSQSPEIQATTIRWYLTQAEPDRFRQLLNAPLWASLSPKSRGEILNRGTATPTLSMVLLEALEKGSISKSSVPAALRRQLISNREESITKKARLVFGGEGESDRRKVYEDYKSVLLLKPDPRNGQKVFIRVCASCHRLDREGMPVGPDLFSIRNQPKEAILLHVVDPDAEIVPGFSNYDLDLKDGRTISGLVVSETENALTLRNATGQDETFPREEIIKIHGSTSSMMPAGLEEAMTRQELSDLVAYLKGE